MTRKTIFVGGPIQHAIRGGRYDERFRSHIVELIRALRASSYEVVSALEEGYLDGRNVDIQPAAATRRDHASVTTCTVYLCIWPIDERGEVYRSDGTCIELGWASAAKKPCVIIRDLTTKYSDLVEGLGSVTNAVYIGFDEYISRPHFLLEVLEKIVVAR